MSNTDQSCGIIIRAEYGSKGPYGHWRSSPEARNAPPVNRTPTSREAARRIYLHCQSLIDRIEQWLLAQGRRGGTNAEAAEALGLRGSTTSARVNELTRDGVLVTTQQTRLTASGQPAAVRLHRQYAAEVMP